jgi:hypothetical protein
VIAIIAQPEMRPVVVVSSDTDLLQLLSYRNVRIYEPRHGVMLNDVSFVGKYGFHPRWWAWGISSCGPCSEWPPFRWASRWRRSRCSCRRWRAPFRSRSVWSS